MKLIFGQRWLVWPGQLEGRGQGLNEGQGPRQEKSSSSVWEASWWGGCRLKHEPLILEPSFTFRTGVNMGSDSFRGDRTPCHMSPAMFAPLVLARTTRKASDMGMLSEHCSLVVITCSKKAPERVRASTSEYSPIIPQKSITTNAQIRILLCWPSFSFLCESGELRNWWMKLFTGGLSTLRARLVSTKPHVSGWSVVWRGADDRIRLLQEMETWLSITAPY